MPSPTNSMVLLDPTALVKVGRLSLESRQAMQGSVAGKHKSPNRGSSVEFAEYREYMPGDDLRRMDWRAYGRSDRFYIKEFEADTNLRLCMLVDGSGSMEYGAESESGLSKFHYASRMAALLGFVAVRQGDAAGLTITAEGDETHLPPRRRPSHLSLIQDALRAARPKGETNLVQALHDMAERNRQRAMVVVFSDLFCDPNALGDCFQHLRFRKHDAIAFHLLERREIDFKFDRTTRFEDLEGGAPLVADPSTIGSQYRAALERYQSELADVVSTSGVDYHVAMLDEAPEDVLARFLVGRSQGKGRR